MMTNLNEWLQWKINNCETVFEYANTNSEELYLKGMLKHGGELNALLMTIGKRQAYIEVMDYLRRNNNDK